MRLFAAIAATIAFAGTAAAAPPPVYVKHTEVTVVVTKGEGMHALLSPSYNLVGNQRTIKCEQDDGCLMTVASMIEMSNLTGVWAICTLIDGVPTTTRCARQNPALGKELIVGNALASTLLAKGRHVIETGVDVKDNTGAELGTWEMHYMMLLDAPGGHK